MLFNALNLTLQVCTFTFRLADGIAQGMWNASGMSLLVEHLLKPIDAMLKVPHVACICAALATYIFLEWGRSTKVGPCP